MSDTIEIVLLLRLVVAGAAKSNIRNEKIVRRLETARWIEQSGRKGEWRPRDDAATKLEQRLDGLLPTWQLDVALLNRLGQSPYDVNAIAALPALRRQVVPSGMVNRRNWNAAKGVGPKHRARLAAETRLTKDWGIRFRPNRGLIARFADQVLDLFETRAILSECFIPERAWLRFRAFDGTLPVRIVTCENLGAYIDLPVPDSFLVAFSPGKDIEPAVTLLKALPDVPWIHFGDMDPEGLHIGQAIARATERPLQFFVPPFATEYLDAAPLVKTPWGDLPAIPLLNALKRSGRRLFQETLMLDPRIGEEIVKWQ